MNRPIPIRARRIVQEGRRLALKENFAEAEGKFRQAIRIAPHFVEAHLDLVHLRAYYLENVAGAEAEYRALAAAQPVNPIFSFVLARRLGSFLEPGEYERLLRQATELVPRWAWAHLARAYLLMAEKKYEDVVSELEQFVGMQADSQEGWRLLATYSERLGRWAQAGRAHRRLAALRGEPVSLSVWRAELRASGGTEEAQTRLRQELARWQKTELAPPYRRQIASAYRDLLGDAETARATETEPTPTQPDSEKDLDRFERGGSWMLLSEMDGPQRGLFGGQSAWIDSQLAERLRDAKDVSQGVACLRAALGERPQAGLRRSIQYQLLLALLEAKDWAGAKATVAERVASKPDRIEGRVTLALALADSKVDLDEASHLVEEASALRREFQPRIRTNQFARAEWERLAGSSEQQRQAYNNTLAALADARGWVCGQQENLAQAERALRTALGMNLTQQVQYHLGVVLDRQGKTEEALEILIQAAAKKGAFQEAARKAAGAVFQKQQAAGVDAMIERARRDRMEEKRAQLRREFIQEPSKDFELAALDGQKYRLSSLRGKVVLVNFWSTWCVPCVEEMPELVELYQKYRDAGLEILAISADEDPVKVKEFAEERKLPFPVFLDHKVRDLHRVIGLPDHLLFDRAGNLRYRRAGFWPGLETILEAAVEELLTSTSAPSSPPP